MKEIKLQITPKGGIQMLHDDAVDLSQFGKIEVTRASHVEFFDGQVSSDEFKRFEGMAVGWYVQSAKTLDVLKSGCSTRAEALAWEKEWYSPGGGGWSELAGDL